MATKVQQKRTSYIKAASKVGLKAEAEVDVWMERFEWSYRESSSDLQRLQDLQNIYDNVVDDSVWATTSKIPIPMLFSMVEKTIPDIFFYLFPNDRFLRLTPMERGVPIERIENAEMALHQTFMNRMRFPWRALPTLRDCFKIGVGYGAIEPIVITPPAAFVNTAESDGQVISARTIGVGKPRLAIRYKHVSPGEIIVSPDGNDFNGPHRVSHAFRMDTYSEQEFRDLYSSSAVDGEKPDLMGDVDQIIDEAWSLGFDTTVAIVDLVRALGGYDLAKTNSNKDRRIPVRIPVLKIYTPHEHVWIANGTRIIYKSEDKYQALHTPLLKCSAWPDGVRWYPVCSSEAAQGMCIGVNLWVNAIIDLVMQSMKPILAYDKSLTGNKPPERGPNGEIGMSGPVRDAIHYLENPRVDPSVFSIGDILQRWYGTTVGQEAFLDQASPGLVRGGMFAFESLLQSTTGRTKMAGAILDMGFIEPALRQTLVQMQMNISEGPDIYPIREYDPDTGKESMSYLDVTEEDLVNAFDLTVDLKEKMRNSAAEQQMRQAEFNTLKDDPYVDQWMVRKRYIGEGEDARRLLFPRERVQEIQQERLRAEQAALASGATRAPAIPRTTTTEQAAAGAGIA